MNKINDRNYSALNKFAKLNGADLFGVADIRPIRDKFLITPQVAKKFDRAVCLGVRLSAGILSEIEGAPTRLYFHHYRAVNICLDQLALRIGNYIQDKGYLSLPIPASIIVDWEKQTAHLSHKEIGVLAGLGWIGRNNLLVNKGLGSRFRLATILTDMPLKTDRPVKFGCSECMACVKICPAGAINKEPAEFDHLKCFEKLKQFQKQKLVDQYVCGVCLHACGPEK